MVFKKQSGFAVVLVLEDYVEAAKTGLDTAKTGPDSQRIENWPFKKLEGPDGRACTGLEEIICLDSHRMYDLTSTFSDTYILTYLRKCNQVSTYLSTYLVLEVFVLLLLYL